MNDDLQEKLIEAVRKYPCVWDVTSLSFKDKDCKAKENAWKSVPEEVKVCN